MINSITYGKDVRKKQSDLTDYQFIQILATSGIAYLVRLCDFSYIEKLDILHKHEMMTELYLLLHEIKAQATIVFKFTPTLLTDGNGYWLNEGEEDNTEAVIPVIMDTQPISKDGITLQNFLSEKMSSKITTVHGKRLLNFLMEKWNEK